MKKHGKNNERESKVKPPAEKFVFLVNNKRQYYSVNRFQGEGEIHGKGGDLFQ
jgi:hypothetical protein